jgi:exodeoxyribonuclease VII small subunit
MAKTNTFEQSMEELEKVVSTLEKGECSLDEAVKLFEKGVKLSNECNEALDKAEQKIKILTEENIVKSGGEEE